MKLIDPEYLEYTSTGLTYVNPDYWKMIEEEFYLRYRGGREMAHRPIDGIPEIAEVRCNNGNKRLFRIINAAVDFSPGSTVYNFECVDYNDAIYYHHSKPPKKIRGIEPKPKKVIFNDPATIIYWDDGTKTVVKCVDEKFDKEKGLAMAISKKALGNQGNYYNYIKKFLKENDNE